MSQTPSWRLRGLLLLFSLGLAALLGEAALRAVSVRLPIPFLIYLHPELRSTPIWQRIREAVPTLAIRQEDAETGWTYKPNLTLTGPNEDGQTYEARTSSEGFFTPDLPDKATSQLITVGASFLATFYVGTPLQVALREAIAAPVYNIAAGGWGPENFHAAYEKFAAGRRHDVVAVFTAASDMAIVNNWNTWKAEGTSESFMTWTQRSAVADDSVNRGQSWPDRHLLLWNLVKFTARRSPATGAVGQQPFGGAITGGATLEQFGAAPGRFDLQLTRGQLFMENDPDAFLPGGSYYSYMQAYFESLLRLKRRAEQGRARMVLVWVPLKERVYLPLLPPDRQASYVTNRTREIGGMEQAVAQFAQQEGISFLDLVPPLVERAQAGEKLYFTVDGHFNSHGNAVVGRLVADFIKGLPPQAPEPRMTGTPLYLLRGSEQIERPLRPSDMMPQSSIVRPGQTGWVARGRAEARYGYLAQWPATTITEPQWLFATGSVRRGGITVGLLKDNQWAVQVNVDHRGTFNIAVPITKPGEYVAVVANNLPGESLDTDVEFTSIGFAAIKP